MTQLAKATIHGKIVESITKEPIGAVMIGDINGFSGYTDKQGEFRLPNIPVEPSPYQYEVNFYRAGYIGISQTYRFIEGDNDLGIIEMTCECSPMTKEFLCSYCGQVFSSEIVMRQHILGNHDVETYFPCQVCGQRFHSRAELKQHMLIHTTLPKFTCPSCSLEINFCPQCGRRFS